MQDTTLHIYTAHIKLYLQDRNTTLHMSGMIPYCPVFLPQKESTHHVDPPCFVSILLGPMRCLKRSFVMERKAIPNGVFKLDGNRIEKMPCDFIESSFEGRIPGFVTFFECSLMNLSTL
jgi:hypothetical protein